MIRNQGAQANKSGGILEANVKTILNEHDYFQVGHHVPKEIIGNAALLPKRYGRQIDIGMGIYQTALNVDFYIVGIPKFTSGLIIECKYQESGGSVDEKFPYLNLNIQHCYPAPTIVVMGGTGMRQGALDWLKNQVECNHNLVAVNSLDRFIAWANKNL
ncbi:PD-(D/E)XK nuclease superfamily protein [Calothrix rhizosoleniae]|uniref:PD-(D/E)XK nuclease superfamily protein n=1 Tax=Calothrix rhizosoleniae TaxID=888997 RepID=UPI000B49C300|nr:PD-(D/E)XK nuclease superfamily protein [Calothrix rhizosoleniae]